LDQFQLSKWKVDNIQDSETGIPVSYEELVIPILRKKDEEMQDQDEK
jgi:hypothetical protein